MHFGTVSSDFRTVYDVVKRAQTHALDAIRPGVTFAAVDAVARDVIRDAGHGEHFGHALGHGVGREVHESPVVREGNEARLKSGMVFTIEPGIYIPGWGGVRIEDMVLVTDAGVRVLSDFEKDLDFVREMLSEQLVTETAVAAVACELDPEQSTRVLENLRRCH